LRPCSIPSNVVQEQPTSLLAWLLYIPRALQKPEYETSIRALVQATVDQTGNTFKATQDWNATQDPQRVLVRCKAPLYVDGPKVIQFGYATWNRYCAEAMQATLGGRSLKKDNSSRFQ
jgi:hypothetical protein